MDPTTLNNWGVDWAWSLPLIVLTVVIHSYRLGLIDQEVTALLSGTGRLRNLSTAWVFVMGGAALSATVLHGLEGSIWAGAYRLLGALPDHKSAMLYWLNAMTSYGHANVYLEPTGKDGCLGSAERLDSLWPNNRTSIHGNSEGVASRVRQAGVKKIARIGLRTCSAIPYKEVLLLSEYLSRAAQAMLVQIDWQYIIRPIAEPEGRS